MSKEAKEVTLHAMEEPGFFGLKQLHRFFVDDIAPVFASRSHCRFVLDFSNVIYWDISALLWMVIALRHFQDRSVEEDRHTVLKLRLPEPKDHGRPFADMLKADQNYARSADYLRRWRFIDALKNLADDPEEMLVESQRGYISGEPVHYFPREIVGPAGLVDQLLSLRLAEIHNLVDLAVPLQHRRVSKERIETSVQDFIVHAVADVLHNQCGIAVDVANMFVTHLLYEGLENVLQHPNATIGMFSVSRTGADRLVLAIADNGDSICKTIYEHYRQTLGSEAMRLPHVYHRCALPSEVRRDLVVHATQAGTSRKLMAAELNWQETSLRTTVERGADIGIGLTHIRDATTKDFGGNLTVVTDGISIDFTTPSGNHESVPDSEDLGFPWQGNLLRIQIQATDRLASRPQFSKACVG